MIVAKELPFLASFSTAVKHSCHLSSFPIYHIYDTCKPHYPQGKYKRLNNISIAEKTDEEISGKSELNLNYFPLSILSIFVARISENKGLFTIQNVIFCTSRYALTF